ncbi:hypothetical protein X551_04364 [Methylibium sp. T29]|nr:hypothetical protein X551_04364 [Methylibium sp. T29]
MVEHGRQRRAVALRHVRVEVLVAQRVEQAVGHQRLRHQDLEPVARDEKVLHLAAQALPGRVLDPVAVRLVERGAGVAVHQQADAREVLGQAQAVHRAHHRGLRHRGAPAVGGHVAQVGVGAPLVVAQRHEGEDDGLARLGRQLRQQGTPVGELHLPVQRLLLLGARHRVAAVVVLARVLQRVPVGHLDGGAALVVEVALGVPQRLVVVVHLGLDVVGGLLVARGRLVAEAPRQVPEGLAHRLDGLGADFDGHGLFVSWCSGVLSFRCRGRGLFVGSVSAVAPLGLLGVDARAFGRAERTRPLRGAEGVEGRARQDQLHPQVGVAEREIELDEAVATLVAQAHPAGRSGPWRMKRHDGHA